MMMLSLLQQQVAAAFPLATVELDEPLHNGGIEHLDIRLGDRLVVVDWQQTLGFGISLIVEVALDGGPDFRVAEDNQAFACVKLLLSEAQDADLQRDLGTGQVTSEQAALQEEAAVNKGDCLPPRKWAA